MKTEEVIVRKSYRGGTEVSLASTITPNSIARLASAMAERFALVAAMPDGEDSAGRQKLRLPTAEECAVRSCDLAQALWGEFSRRDWLITLPLPTEPEEG